MTSQVIEGDCVEVMRSLDDASVDAVVCDPPYMLGFMGKAWDTLSPGDIQHGHDRWATEAFRVLKPGGFLIAAGGTRTYHRLACAVEDAGFEIRDCIAWMYGSGFPKSHNLSGDWEGWGTALKPSYEPWVLARKPLSGTVAANVLAHGTGALNVSACRISENGQPTAPAEYIVPDGRWPANTVVDGAVADTLPPWFYTAKASRGERNAGLEGFEEQDGLGQQVSAAGGTAGVGNHNPTCQSCGGSQIDRGKGVCVCEQPEWRAVNRSTANSHPTVKPIDLMRWLCRLVTPPGGLILDPFAGSGTTGIAAHLEGFDFIGIEREAEYAAIAKARIEWWAKFPPGTDVDKALGVAAVDRVHSENGQGTLL